MLVFLILKSLCFLSGSIMMQTVFNGSGEFSNATNYTFHDFPSRCTGSWPSKTVELIIYSMLMTFSLLGNFLIVAIFYRNTRLRGPVHYFIVNMAFSDLVMPVIMLPWWISAIHHDGIWLIDGVFGAFICKLAGMAWGVSTFVSILSMIAIAADRFHAVLFPMRSALFSRNKCLLIIAATWVLSVAYRAHYLYAMKLLSFGTGLYCVFQWEPASYMREVSKITWILSFCLFSVSAIVLTVLYSSIIVFLYKQKNLLLASEVTRSRAKENRQVTCMLVIIVIVFYTVWIPHHVVYFISYLKPSSGLSCVFTWFSDVFFPLLYPIINPVVYFIFNANYRRGLRELLCCPWRCSNNSNGCFQPSVPPQGENNIHNPKKVNNFTENIELQEQ